MQESKISFPLPPPLLYYKDTKLFILHWVEFYFQQNRIEII